MPENNELFILYKDDTMEVSTCNQLWGTQGKGLLDKGKVILVLSDKSKAADLKCAGEEEVIVADTSELLSHTKEFTGTIHCLPFTSLSHAKGLISAPENGVTFYRRVDEKGNDLRSLGEKMRSGIANLFTGNRWLDLSLGMVSFQGTAFQLATENLELTSEHPYKSIQRIVAQACHQGASFEESAITAKPKEQKLKGLIPFTGQHKLLALSLIKQLMWKVPLKEMKSENTGHIFQQDHPIHKPLFLLLAVLFAVLMPFMSLDFGINWDEVEIINYTNDVLNYYLSLGDDRTALEGKKRLYSELVFYGLSFDTFLAFVNRFLSPFGVYETRHMLTALCGFVGVLFIGFTAKELSSWRAGLIGLVMAFLSPYFLGHAMTNTKDIPFAVFYIMGSYFMVRIVRRLPNRVHFKDLLFFSLALAAIFSIRAGGILLLAYMGMFVGLSWLAYVSRHSLAKGFKLIPRYAKYVLGVGILGYILGILVWPYALENPIDGPTEALSQFTKFSFLTIYELFEGQRIYMSEVPWYYIPKFLLIGNPLHVVIGFFLGVAMLVVNRKKVYAWGGVIMLFILVFPVAYAAYKESTLYNGWRHFLFVFPPMAVIAAIGWDQLFVAAKRKPLQMGGSIVLLVLFGLTSFWIIGNHPNEYVYYNQFVGTHAGAYGNYESDPYGHVVREGVEWMVENELPENPDEKIYITTNFDVSSGQYFLNKYHDSVKFVWAREYERFSKQSDYMLIGPRTFGREQLNNGGFPPKETIHTIDVDGKPILAIVKIENKNLLKAHTLTRSNQFQQAIPLLEEYTKYDPNNEEAWRLLGSSYLQTNQIAKAETALSKAIELFPESYIAHYYMGFVHLRKNDLNSAVASFEKSLDSKINYSMSYFQLANVYMQNKNYTNALEWYYGYLFDQANMNTTFWDLKGERRVKLSDYEEALDGNVSASTSPQILNSVATCWLAINNHERAIQYFNYTLSVDKNYMPAYQGMAEVYRQKGDNATAQQYLNAAKQLSNQ